MTLFLIIGAVMLGTITGTLTARRGDLLSLAISLAALLMLALLAQPGRSIRSGPMSVTEGPKCVLAGLNTLLSMTYAFACVTLVWRGSKRRRTKTTRIMIVHLRQRGYSQLRPARVF